MIATRSVAAWHAQPPGPAAPDSLLLTRSCASPLLDPLAATVPGRQQQNAGERARPLSLTLSSSKDSLRDLFPHLQKEENKTNLTE